MNLPSVIGENRFGIKLTPYLGLTNVKPSNYSSYSAMGFSAGFLYDLSFKENHYFSTGIHFSNRGIHITRIDEEGKKDSKKSNSQTFYVSYIKTPILLKLYSSEIFIDTQLYLQTGALVSLKVVESKPKNLSPKDNLFRRFLLEFTLGGGIEYEFAMTTSMFAELGYRISMFDMIHTSKKENELKSLWGHIISLSIGLRF